MSEQEPPGQPTPEEAVQAVEGTEPVAEAATPVVEPEPVVEPIAAAPDPEPAPDPAVASPPADWPPADWPPSATGTADDRPEVGVGAAFAGGIVAAWLLKRLARRKHRRA